MKNFFQSFWIHWKYSKLLRKIYKSENLIQNLTDLFGVKFKIDWIGRIYAVFNPNIQNGQFDQNSQIFEYNERGFDNSMLVEKRIMEMLSIASRFIRAKNLFDLLTYKIKKLDKYDNYLFIIQPITLDEYGKNIKKLVIFGSSLIIIAIGILICLKFVL